MDRLQDSTGEQDPSIRTWFDVEHAEMLERAGKRELARARYTEGLKRAPRDLGLIAGYADFLLDDGLYLEAERLTEPWRRVDAVRLRYALARKGQGKENVLDVKMLSESFEAARRRGEELHLREEARFVLDVLGRPAEALALAQKNWAVQREPSDIRLVLTAAQRACSPRAAFPALEWLKEAKMEDARLPKPTASAP